MIEGEGRRRSEGVEALVIEMDLGHITDCRFPVFCLTCSRTSVIVAHPLQSKAVTQELLRTVAKGIASMGHTKIVVKCNEMAAKALAGRILDVRSQPTITKESLEYEVEANGLAECSWRKAA